MKSTQTTSSCSCFSPQPIQLISNNIEVAKAGKVPAGKTEIPFEFPLNTKGNKVLYETYHGVFVNIQVSEGPRKEVCSNFLSALSKLFKNYDCVPCLIQKMKLL